MSEFFLPHDFERLILSVKVVLEPLTESFWYEMKREQSNLPSLSEAALKECSFCLETLHSIPHIKCAECDMEVLICITCFRHGVQSGGHRRGHNYEICDPVGPPFFDDNSDDKWGCFEDMNLIWSFYRSHLDQWPEISNDFCRRRSLKEALDRIDKYFLCSDFGLYVTKKYKRPGVNIFDDESQKTNKEFEYLSHSSRSNETCSNSQTFASNDVFLDNPSPSIISASFPSNANDPSNNKRSKFGRKFSSNNHEAYSSFQYEESCNGFKSVGSRRSSMKPGAVTGITPNAQCLIDTPTSTFSDHFKNSRREILESAKAETAEALKSLLNSSNSRRSSLELFEAINNSTTYSPLRTPPAESNSNLYLNEKLINLFSQSCPSPYFYFQRSSSSSPVKFDQEDLQLVTYMPLRDEFENEFKNDAEKLISQVIFAKENERTASEVEKFMDEVRFVRLNIYNRIMKMRATKHSVIQEHGILNEFFRIVKSNISEKGKYSVFGEKYFNSKRKEEYFRPLFFQMRQVAEKSTIRQLAENIGAMELLKDQIDELRDLKKKGVTKLKGKLKVDSSPALRNIRRRRIRKMDNYGIRKANLRWKRIIRWSKKNGQSDDSE